MKEWNILLVFFFLYLSFDISAQENKNVLLISSYNSRFPTYFQQINGIKSILDTTDVNLDVEFMDSKRFTKPATYDLFYKSLKNKLANSTKYDEVLTADDDAFNFVLRHEDELFKNIPIVFFGVNNIEKALKQNSNPYVTGIVESVSMKETIELMIRLFPETGSVYCITDSTSSGLSDLELYRKISAQIPNTKFKEINLSQLTYSEYKAKLKTISSNTPVLLLSAYSDKIHNTVDFHNTINHLHKNLNAPLFHLWEHGMGNGVFGGKIISHFDQGKKAAEVVCNILSGQSISDIRVVNESPNVFMFDYNQLIRYNVPLNKLPDNSIIINQPVSFWNKYKQAILITLLILLALLALIAVLSANIIKRKKIEKLLKIQNSDILKLNHDLVTAKLKAEEGEKKFKQLFYDHTAVKLLICAETGQIFDANPAAAAFYGWSLQELCQMNIGDINTLPISEIKKIIALAKKNGKVYLEFKHRKANGVATAVEVFSSTINISGKQYLYSIVHDISEKKKQEHLIRLLSRSVEQSPVAITITDKKGIIEYVNQAFVKITGYTSDEAIGQNTTRLLKSGKTPNTVYKELWNTINAGKTWSGEFQNKKSNGEFYWVNKAISPIYEDQVLTNFVSVSEDITERKRIIEDLVVAKEKAQESTQLKSAFLANMSHEIRTPMNGILGFAGLLKEPYLTDKKQQKYIQIIEKSGARMLNIINNIVSISKIEAGIVDINLSETNINNQLQFVYDSLKLDADHKNLKLCFTCELPEKESTINTDSEKFYGTLSNLVKNAIKYTDEGTIEFGCINKGEEVEFYVKDSGIGISTEKAEVIFERFIQADITDKMARQGAGLGLAISRAYVEMLGGRIWVESEESKGSTFFFTLPCNINSKKENDILIDKIPENETESIISEVSDLKVLIAEDDEASEMLISIKLKKFSKEILKATNGIDAIETCRQHSDIDLVLMDIQMPKMNGYQATREIRKFNKNVIIIAQTAFALTGDKDKAIEAGCNDYITKPVNEMELQEMIRRYFGE
ncbi:ABC transporter substrate binding protein [Lutibacter sp. TH_r2]|uniref:ABC transporter substrate binding protein n=1 Tax=Lutibacter sp. TH_r2 TaxID=3082083 RepID=UPI0029549C07|nr:ABC transporter substrate binding protein [Lutibacter sp. TH_r2]MDV7187411.1 ABC transporter substrate binding protein [Lutibacter sp. TH_r2]